MINVWFIVIIFGPGGSASSFVPVEYSTQAQCNEALVEFVKTNTIDTQWTMSKDKIWVKDRIHCMPVRKPHNP